VDPSPTTDQDRGVYAPDAIGPRSRRSGRIPSMGQTDVDGVSAWVRLDVVFGCAEYLWLDGQCR